jgi:hypothetical protein
MRKSYTTTTSVILGILAFSLVSFSSTLAQDRDYKSLHDRYGLSYRSFRISFVPGLSTNGIRSTRYASRYSLNILAGYNGALDRGLEVGSLINANKYYTHGTQIAGIGNYSGAETSGVQIAGVFNYSGEEMQGLQFAGIANLSRDDMQGIQVTGGFNWTAGTAQGIHISGLANIAKTDMQGLFSAGFGNITSGSMQGILLAGITNFSGGDMQGIVVSGLLNSSEFVQGIAVGSINISKEIQGMQIGALNAAREVQGIQIGLINYAHTMEGLPIGLISYYSTGRHNADVWVSDAGFINTGIKLGTEEVYNMISIGYNPALNRDVWQLGWSIGRHYEYQSHFQYSDFSIFKINESEWTSDLNLLFKYRLLFGKNLGSGIQLYGGPTFNMLISKIPESNDYTWYRLFDFEAKRRSYIFWIGYSIGLELF